MFIQRQPTGMVVLLMVIQRQPTGMVVLLMVIQRQPTVSASCLSSTGPCHVGSLFTNEEHKNNGS